MRDCKPDQQQYSFKSEDVSSSARTTPRVSARDPSLAQHVDLTLISCYQ
jgi:hypothetical protein